jgi:carboxypeptidase C (cathepsin A)
MVFGKKSLPFTEYWATVSPFLKIERSMIQTVFTLIALCSIFLGAEEKITTHLIELENETISYTATVFSGDVSYIAYVKQTTENRPITFAFNGGPGSSSVWLHMGMMGPRRLLSPEEGQTIAPPYKLVDNMETLLDLTDLVFIDPPGTGFSKSDQECYSVKTDIESIGKFIRTYLTQNQRWNSPKYLAGESYGALRSAGLAALLQNEYGIYLNGVIFISAAIDFQTFLFNPDNPLPYFLYLPTFVTTAWYHDYYRPDATIEEVAQEAREFIYQTYAPSLLCPKCPSGQSLYQKLSEMTGLSIEVIEKNRGRIDDDTFQVHLLSKQRKIVGRFDSRITGFCENRFQDPSASMIEGIFSGALHDYLHKELGFQNSYTLFSTAVNEQWNFHSYNEWGYPNLMGALRRALTSNPQLKIFVGCGYFDLATPFATAEYCFDHLDIPEVYPQIEYYEGGHMYYLNPSARIKFKQDLIRFYKKN